MNMLTAGSDGHAFEAIVARGCTLWAFVARVEQSGPMLAGLHISLICATGCNSAPSSGVTMVKKSQVTVC